MRRRLIKIIADSALTRQFMRSPSPQWLVFVVDMLVVIFSALLTLQFNADATPAQEGWLFTSAAKIIAVTAVYAVVMLVVTPYKYIVRLSAFEDTYRIAQTVVGASVILAVLEVVVNWTGTERFVGLWSIFVLGVITFAILVCIRLIIKFVYRMVTSDAKRTRVAMLGSVINSYALASVLSAEADGRFLPVMMLSLSDSNSNTRVNGIPIRHYSPETVAQVFNEAKCDTLLFMPSQIEFMRAGAADVFLANNIKLMMLNKIEEFDLASGDASGLSGHVQDIKIEDLLGRDPIVCDNPSIGKSLRDKTVLITGAAGSIGSEIVRQVLNFHPGRLVLVDQAETPMHNLQLELDQRPHDAQIELCIADVVNAERMTDIFSHYRPQIVYHAAAYKHVPMMERNPTEAVQTNIFGTKLMADLSMRFGVERFVMISTDKAVNPTNIMGASKRIAEIYVQSLAMNLQRAGRRSTRFITTRFGNVLGSNGSVIPLFRDQIAKGGPVTVTHRDIIRYFMTIPEACSLVLEAGCMGDGGEIFIFDMGQPVKIYDLATRMIRLAGLMPGKDIEIVETGLRPGEKLFEELLNDHEHTIATHHKKIMIAKVRTYDYTDVCQRLAGLSELLDHRNVHDIVAQMKRIVPEFKSQNSQFQTIDLEITDAEVIHERV